MIGQGKPLPSFMQLDGEWIIENHIFLYHSKSRVASTATFTIGAEKEDGSHAIGFDSVQLAATLGVDIPTLLEGNRNGTLIFLGDMDAAPSHGGISAKAYSFRLGEHQGFLTIEIDQQEGTA